MCANNPSVLKTLIIFSEFTFGSAIEDQQLGCLWQGDYLLTVSLSGNINYLDTNNPTCPKRILKVFNGWYGLYV